MKKAAVECIGTFFLVLTIGLVVRANQPAGVLAIGFVLMALVYMGGPISGAHYNPAVTAAAWVAKKIDATESIGYIVSQLIGSIAASVTCHFLVGSPFAVTPTAPPEKALAAELLFTFALVSVILQVACSKRSAGNSYFGLAIGATIVAAAYAIGGVSGGALNPAVGIGPNLVSAVFAPNGGKNPLQHVWLYIVGPVSGAVLAGLLFNWLESEKKSQ